MTKKIHWGVLDVAAIAVKKVIPANPLPNHLHVPWVMQAADAGKHVLCEKPLDLPTAEARTLLNVCDRAKVNVGDACMVHTRRVVGLLERDPDLHADLENRSISAQAAAIDYLHNYFERRYPG